jgi:hypothetical protein
VKTKLLTPSAATTLAIAMLAAPAAVARPIDSYDPMPAPTTAPPATAEPNDGFDWGAAGIGAGVAVAIVALTAGGLRIRPGARVGHAG